LKTASPSLSGISHWSLISYAPNSPPKSLIIKPGTAGINEAPHRKRWWGIKRNSAIVYPASLLRASPWSTSPFIPAASHRVFWRRRIKNHAQGTWFMQKHHDRRSRLFFSRRHLKKNSTHYSSLPNYKTGINTLGLEKLLCKYFRNLNIIFLAGKDINIRGAGAFGKVSHNGAGFNKLHQ